MLLEELHLNSVVEKRKTLDFQIKKTAAGNVIIFGKQEMSVSKIFDLSLFMKDEPFKVADIGGLITNNGKLTLVRQFVEAGFLQITEN